MANPNHIQIDPIKYLNNIAQYNGNRNDLITFTRLIDRIHPLLTTYDELSQLVFSDIIKSRLVGKAREVIEINTQAQSWNSIKSVLENNFGEKKSCEELFDELRAVTFNKTTIDFYNDIKYRLRRLCNKAIMVLGEGEAANQVALNNQRSALHVFKNKMPEPMRTVLACRNPSTLEEAMDILFENGYDRMGKDGRIVRKQVNEQSQEGQNQDQGNNNNRSSNNNRNDPKKNYTNNNRNNNRQNYRRENNNSYQNNQEHNLNNQSFYNNQNYQQVQQQHAQQPEPMEVNNVENFQESASTDNFHI